MNWLDEIKFDADGLIPAIAQDEDTDRVLMMAWMNRESLNQTQETGKAIYWSRSRGRFWRKGEESGHEQIVSEIRIDCDSDVLILKVRQVGNIACHTGRTSCFHKILKDGQWQVVEPVIKDPGDIYQSDLPK